MIGIIAAMGEGRVIGVDGTIPWRYPGDLRRFKEVTMGSAVVMGRVTWESIPAKFRPLSGRVNVVVSKTLHDDPAESIGGADRAVSIMAALDWLRYVRGCGDVWFIGGERIYTFAAVTPATSSAETGASSCTRPSTTSGASAMPSADRVGPENLANIGRELREGAHKVAHVVAAWGNHTSIAGDDAHRRALAFVVLASGYTLECLRQNKDGSPAHPLYLPSLLRPVPLPPGPATDSQQPPTAPTRCDR